MDSRTILLTVHIAAVAGWLGADLLQHAVSSRLARDSASTALAWARQQLWLHERYYPAVAVVVVVSGVLLVLDGDWSWSSGFIWVGVAAVVGGATLGGGGLGSLTKQQVAALEGGDTAGAAAAHRRSALLGIVVTLLPLIAIVAMVERWRARA